MKNLHEKCIYKWIRLKNMKNTNIFLSIFMFGSMQSFEIVASKPEITAKRLYLLFVIVKILYLGIF